MGKEDTPLGLTRVLTRLQHIPLPERTAGKSKALGQVARNARYVESLAMAAPQVNAPLPGVPAAEPEASPDAEPESAPAPATDVVV